ncbi:DUF1850 domain-containing protein [Devosia sp. CAU 1758]
MAPAPAADGGCVLMLCVASAGTVMALVASSFTLSWTHSVEKTQWRESWLIEGESLKLAEASVEGPGAGIAIPPDAVWADNRWTYLPRLPPLPELVLAASGMTPSPWLLCITDGACHTLGATTDDPVRLWAAPACRPQ